MIESILDDVADFFDVDRRGLSCEVYNGRNFVTVLVYQAEKPLVVCRVPRWSADDLEAECANLRHVASLVAENDLLLRTTERIIAVHTIGTKPVLLKRFLPGVKAGELPDNPAVVGRFLRSSTEWLIEFADATEKHRLHASDEKRQRVSELTGCPDPCDEWTFVHHDDFFIGPMHGDFAPGNVLLGSDGRLSGVVDFEWFTRYGVPLFDFLHLVVSTGSIMYDSPRSAIEGTFFDENDFTDHVRDCLICFREGLEISRKTFRQSLPLYPAIRLAYGHDAVITDKLRSMLLERQEEVVWI